MRIQLLILFIYFSSTFCSITNRIYGGYEVSIEEAPYQVESYYNTCWNCGGSLLSKKFVLSAAHCYSNDNPHINLSVKVGTTKLYDHSGMTINVEKVYNHPDYDYNKTGHDYDFALLQLCDVGEFPAVVQFVRLPSLNDILKDGDEVFITGYGETETDAYSLTLLGTTVKIYNLETCRNNFKDRNVTITTRMICAGYEEGKIDACTGKLTKTHI